MAGFGIPTNRVLTEISGAGAVGAVSVVCTLPNAPSPGSLILISMCWFDGVRTSCNPTAVDGLGNHYLMGEEDGRPLTAGILVFGRPISIPALKDKVITVGFDSLGAGATVSIEIEEFPVTGGTATFNNSLSSSNTTGTPIVLPLISTSAGDLIWETAVSDHQVSTCDAPYTPVVEGISGGSGTGIFGNSAQGIGYLLSSPGGNQAPAFTQNTSSGNCVFMAAFHFVPDPSKTPYQPQYGMAPVMAQ